jgi:hypothetical protein
VDDADCCLAQHSRITAVRDGQNSGSAPDSSSGLAGRSGISGRPRLRPWLPVLRRGPGELQLGLDPESGLVLSGVPDRFEQLLGRLDGTGTIFDIRAAAGACDIDPDLAEHLVQVIGAAGLLSDSTADPPDAEPYAALGGLHLRLIGAGVLGCSVASALLLAGVERLDIVDSDPVDPTLYPRPGLATSQADALRARLRVRGGSSADRPRSPRVQVARHWSKPDHPAPDLTVITTDRAEPDRAIGEDYVRADHPHLYVRPLDGGAVVGPLVLPGRTPCLGCLDRVRQVADPAWPLLLVQLCRTSLPIVPLLASWAGATATVQIACWAAGGDPGTGGGTLELTAVDYQLRVRPWPMHPNCGCGWGI